ncbi:hypothetical protein [Hellea balneolensis]|uniref:hypothetical protein n=1 Tax=Hellea balneolensis TaxID=287478 RepID=UPI000401D077|nr:hypothetical protein [Hellea balneolensis]
MSLKTLFIGGPKPVWVRYLLIIGFFFLITRLILDSSFAHSSLLYCLVPYCVAIVIYIFMPQPQGRYRWQRFARHMFSAMIVMLATSALLFEGFICVLMFMPIYIIFAIIGFAFAPKEYPTKNTADVFRVSFVPIVIAVLSLEGINASLSLEREHSLTRTQIVNLTPEQIHRNLSQPIHLDAKRSTFLSLFPLPTHVEAGSLNTGDIHKAHFKYKRWGHDGFNVKTGETWLKIASVTPLHIQTEVVKDTSYFSHYLTIHGTDIKLNPLNANRTQISLTIHYRRELDPAWYFGPLQKSAITESGEYLIQHVIARGAL